MRTWWSEPQSTPDLVSADYIQLLPLWEHIVNLMMVLTIWWLPCVESPLLCCWKKVFTMTSVFSWQNSVSLHFVLQGQTCLLLQVSLGFLILHSNPLSWKGGFCVCVSSSGSSGGWVISWRALKTTNMNAYKQRQSKVASLSLVWALQWLIKTPVLYMKTLEHI